MGSSVSELGRAALLFQGVTIPMVLLKLLMFMSLSMHAQVALILKLFYDNDVVDESLITAWHDKKSAGRVLGVTAEAAASVRSAAQPFIKWLEEADEDESDGSGSDEE